MNLSPAPWSIVNHSWAKVPTEVVVDNDENTVDPHEVLRIAVMGRNFLDIIMKRGWGVKLFSNGGYGVLGPCLPLHIESERWPDPFTAVIEADKLYREIHGDS